MRHRAGPGDDAPRLILADWLDERGEPDAARALRYTPWWLTESRPEEVTYRLRLLRLPDYLELTAYSSAAGMEVARPLRAPMPACHYCLYAPNYVCGSQTFVAGRGWLCPRCLAEI